MGRNGILIIGGGLLQSYAIAKAREKGFDIYLTDGNKNCYCASLADQFFQIDTKNFQETGELATKLKKSGQIKSVYTQGTDVAFTVAYAASKAGLIGLDPEIAWWTENKIKMRQKLFSSSIDNTKFMVVGNKEELEDCERRVGFPCYVKPADNSGSRGISRVTDPAELATAFDNAMKSCLLEKKVLIEEEILGNEFSIDTIVIDKKLYNAGISDRVFNKKIKYAVQSGSITPSLLSADKQKEMLEIMQKITIAFEINNSALKGDLVIDENGVIRVIEIAARTSGGFDSQVRKPTSFGIDIISLTLDLSLGNDINFNDLIPKWIKWSKTASIFPEPGIVQKIIGDNWVKRNKCVVDYKILINLGDRINSYHDCSKRTNYLTFKADTYESLVTIEKSIQDNFKIVTRKE